MGGDKESNIEQGRDKACLVSTLFDIHMIFVKDHKKQVTVSIFYI
jgi:hypothetical protein